MVDKSRYHSPGDVVTLRQDIANKPDMIVEKLVKLNTTKEDHGRLIGIRCIWFDANLTLQQHNFNSKDLKRVLV